MFQNLVGQSQNLKTNPVRWYCQFCKKNEECRCLREPGYKPNETLWLSHRLKDEYGRCW